ncbi:MAG: glycoside hydrolase family 16 protein [Labilithrix sp.]|nr:glycoside hydrolase family 16 protein [Labilithrix sp.]MCW5817186.1 glycoside hydrolase family 16 protein [Labilithrix sp.]
MRIWPVSLLIAAACGSFGTALPTADGGPDPDAPAPPGPPTPPGPPRPPELPDPATGWRLVWSDEFEDTEKWTREVSCDGGGNNEMQCYTAETKNAFALNGELHILALDDTPPGPQGKTYSSAKLVTKDTFLYGRIEARIRLPHGQGLWPAFWMLPAEAAYGEWPRSGEIDVVQAVNLGDGGGLQNEVHGVLHFGGPAHEKGDVTTPVPDAWTQFHVYAIEWQRDEIRWFVDEKHYATQRHWFTPGHPYPAPFDRRFRLMLNVAVGGNWPGAPNGATTFPQEMTVDYVHVYECAKDPDGGVGCGTRDPNVIPLDGG